MSAKFSVMWQNNTDFKRPMSRHTFRLRDLNLPECPSTTVHVDQVTIIFRPIAGTGAIADTEYVAPDTKDYTWHTETDTLMLRCSPGARYPLFVGDDPSLTGGNQATTTDTAHDARTAQRSLTYSAALAVTPHNVNDESYWVRTYRPIRDLPVVQGTSNLSEWDLELFFPLLHGDKRMLGTSVPDYRIHKVLCEFSVHW